MNDIADARTSRRLMQESNASVSTSAAAASRGYEGMGVDKRKGISDLLRMQLSPAMIEIADAFPNNLLWFQIVSDVEYDKHTEFEMAVVACIEPSKTWNVLRRFSSFKNFH